ncbi:MAG: hypothetical protein AB8C84_10130 [Oligoflexales bacterium]
MRHLNPQNKQKNLAEVIPFKRENKTSSSRPGSTLLKQLTALADSIEKTHKDISSEVSEINHYSKEKES